jgi:hypothetical protein
MSDIFDNLIPVSVVLIMAILREQNNFRKLFIIYFTFVEIKGRRNMKSSVPVIYYLGIKTFCV